MQQSYSTQLVFEEEFEVLEQNTIKRITSSTLSENRRLMLITTGMGFVICDLGTMKYVRYGLRICRYEDQASPFYVRPKGEQTEKKMAPCGCKLGSILESRTQVALIPNFSSQLFKETCVYIYDYNIRIILTKFNFNLPINLFSITNTHIIVSNNKRIVLYNYLKGQPGETEQYYLSTFKSNQATDFINYLELFCHQCDEKHYSLCECGRYVYSKKGQYMKLVYMRIGFAQSVKSRILYLYDEKYGSSNYFYEQKPYDENFQFSITQDGMYLAISQDYGRKINIYNLAKNCLYSVLYLGMSPKSIINLNVVTLPDGSEWVIASRSKQGIQATMHMFTLNQTSTTELVKSIYKRKFKLYKKTMQDYEIFQDIGNFIPPEIFMHEYKLYALSLVGEYCELIDFNRSGLHKEGTVNDYRSIEPQTLNRE